MGIPEFFSCSRSRRNVLCVVSRIDLSDSPYVTVTQGDADMLAHVGSVFASVMTLRVHQIRSIPRYRFHFRPADGRSHWTQLSPYTADSAAVTPDVSASVAGK